MTVRLTARPGRTRPTAAPPSTASSAPRASAWRRPSSATASPSAATVQTNIPSAVGFGGRVQ